MLVEEKTSVRDGSVLYILSKVQMLSKHAFSSCSDCSLEIFPTSQMPLSTFSVKLAPLIFIYTSPYLKQLLKSGEYKATFTKKKAT